MKSVMNHGFSNTPSVEIERSTFNRSHGYKTTFDGGYLIPFYVDEALPGDTHKVNVSAIARLSTPTYPIMDNLFLETFFFAVPWRLVWSNFQKFMGEQVDPGDSTDYTVPVVATRSAGEDNESLYDYFGIPTKVPANFNVNVLPLRAYNLIWNEWFRDQNLQDSVEVPKTDGPDTNGTYTLLKRGKKHDYFTSCLPWLQKGDAVSLSLGISAPVVSEGTGIPTFDGASTTDSLVKTSGVLSPQWSGGNPASTATATWSDTALEADLQNATASTVNELRQAVQVQRLLEKDARSGTRYTEIVQSHFGVTSADSRLQRPEYLGGGSTPVNFSAIARTDSSPGRLGAVGVSTFKGHGFVKSFTEHCFIIGLMNVRADLTYQQGLDRMWSRQTRYDLYWPTLAHLGEQSVLNKEIYLDATDIGDGNMDNVFGYQERYAEYRYKKSQITGKLRSNDANTLDAWHLSTEFSDTPGLSDAFIQDNPPIDRVIATPTEPHFIFDSFINQVSTRPMPTYSVPGMMDHF